MTPQNPNSFSDYLEYLFVTGQLDNKENDVTEENEKDKKEDAE